MLFADIKKVLPIHTKKENTYVKLDSFYDQHNPDRNKLLAEFFKVSLISPEFIIAAKRENAMVTGIILGITVSYIALIVYLHQMSK